MKQEKLYKNYRKLCETFKHANNNYPKFMCNILLKIKYLGEQLYENYPIKQLCVDVGITYQKYKFYIKYKIVEEKYNHLIVDNKINPNLMIEIIKRFPEKEIKGIIKKQIKYNIPKNKLIALKKNDNYKDDNEWEKSFNSCNLVKIKRNRTTSTNLRSIRTHCNRLITELKDINAKNMHTRAEIYTLLKQTREEINIFLEENIAWEKIIIVERDNKVKVL